MRWTIGKKRFDDEELVAVDDSNPESSASSSSMLEARAQRSRSKLWLWLLPVLAIALLVETLSANRRLDVRRDGS